MNFQLLEKPIFLVGAERSGTTLLRLMLDHHPEIAWCNEFEYAVDYITEQGDFPQLEKYYQWLATHRIFQNTGFTVNCQLSYPQLVNSFLSQQRDRAGKPLIGATVHRHFDRLLSIWSDARFIHIVRDPRDVARSCMAMGWAGNVWVGVERWQEAEQLWQQLKTILTPERYIEITYETLISQTIKTLTGVCHFIGVPYDPAMLTYAQNTTYDAPDPNLVEQWRRRLSERDIQLVEARVGDLLTSRGYFLSGLPPLTVTEAMKQQLRRQSYWQTLRYRLKKYGWFLVLSGYLSRRLGIKSLEKWVQLQLNAVVNAQLK